ncbi:MAG: HAD family phosphatase [Actinomycetota bacterium]
MAEIEAVLFDMGGVLVELGPLDELLGDAMDGEEFWPRWLASPSVRGLESGRCSVDDFARGLVEELELRITPDEVIERFAGFPRGLYPGAVEVVASVPSGIATGVLSNTNPLHWDHQNDGAIIRDLCQHAFLSYLLGAVKPDREIYDLVAAELTIEPDRILFLDDNQINVDGARAAGWQAEVAKGPAEAAAVLAANGIVAG